MCSGLAPLKRIRTTRSAQVRRVALKKTKLIGASQRLAHTHNDRSTGRRVSGSSLRLFVGCLFASRPHSLASSAVRSPPQPGVDADRTIVHQLPRATASLHGHNELATNAWPSECILNNSVLQLATNHCSALASSETHSQDQVRVPTQVKS